MVLSAAIASPLAARLPRREALQTVAGRAGRLFGAAVRADALSADLGFRSAVSRECGIITPEIEWKWAYLEPQQGHLDFAAADRLADFARVAGKRIHGHALLWHRSIPPWASAVLADRPDWILVRRFLSSVMPRYGDVAFTWDVVNEPVEVGAGPDGLRRSLYHQAFGPDYIERAFEDARMLAPTAALFINEFGIDHDLPEENEKRLLLLRLLERLKKKGVPIDGLGIQAHLDLAKQPYFREAALADFLNDVGSLGLQVRISELDVREANPLQPVADRDAQVAQAVGRYLGVALANRAVGSVTCWGLSDRYSWLSSWGRPAGLNRGLPLDSDFNLKPMANILNVAFASLINSA